MREIKFRGKFASFNQFVPHTDEGKWVYGDLVHDAMLYLGEYHDCIYTDGENGRSMIRVDPNTIGQFTGLHDKNGVEIYEGDIVRKYDLTFGLKWEGVVVYNDAIGCFRIHSENNDITLRMGFEGSDTYNDGQCTAVCKYEYEVIGNIYSND